MAGASRLHERLNLDSFQHPMTDRVTIVPYDPDWPRRFGEECGILAAIFAGTEAVIEHVGSTAVPDLGAKPIIDMMVGLATLGEVQNRIHALESMGYEYVPEYEKQLPERRYFRKPPLPEPRQFHLHCVIQGSEFWIRHLAFRDYLRGHPETAAAYCNLKQELAGRHTRDDYGVAKGPFIEGVLKCAMGEVTVPRDVHAIFPAECCAL